MADPKDKGATSSVWIAVEQVNLPDRKYFKIGEVAQLVGVEPHVLRYWQTQFPQVRPQKSRSGHRLYRRKDVETLLAIRELLHVQRFTIAGARQALRSMVKTRPPSAADGEKRKSRQPASNVEVVAVKAEQLEAIFDAELAAQTGKAHARIDALAETEPTEPASVIRKASESGPILRTDAPAVGAEAQQKLIAAREDLNEVLDILKRADAGTA
jgi:DNA-binding transcriptional MerR regulator